MWILTAWGLGPLACKLFKGRLLPQQEGGPLPQQPSPQLTPGDVLSTTASPHPQKSLLSRFCRLAVVLL